MFCPACGVRNPDDSRFCNQCGANVAVSPPRVDPIAAVPQSPATPGRDPAPLTSRMPTMGSDAYDVSLPMSGPSRRTMTVAAVAIAGCGLAVGAAVAWRAARQHAPTEPSVIPESRVALVETPRVLCCDAGPGPQEAPVAHASNATHTVSPTPARESSRTRPPARSGWQASPPLAPIPAAAQRNQASAATPTPAVPATTQPTAPAEMDMPPAPNSASERTDATGSLEPAAIQAVYREHHTQLAACQLLTGGDNAALGTMVLRVRLGVDGRVLRTRLVSNSTRNTFLATCVQNTVREWAFPRPQGGEVEFEYSLGFGS